MKRGSRKISAPALRARIWVERDSAPAFTEAGADLLEQIQVCGSLSQAARRLGFSYRRAWMLIDGMNKRWPLPLVQTATGGEHGGGSRVTEYGCRVLQSYRNLQAQVETLVDHASAAFHRETQS
jgi:molybdate transport system regulatory protein